MKSLLHPSSIGVSLLILGAMACSEDNTAQEQDLSWQLNNSCQGGAPCPDTNADITISEMNIADSQQDQPFEVPPGMALVTEGPFKMGNNGNGAGIFGEGPEHEVYLSIYAIDIHEVTVDNYKKCVDQGVCTSPKPTDLQRGRCNWGVADRTDHPINCVDWFQSQAYCQWLDKSLPTEAQWEKAARGPDSTIYPWGDEPQPSCDLAIVNKTGSLSGCGTEQTWPVGSRPRGASVYGVMDLIGNVEEWSKDLFDKRYYSVSEYRDPQGPVEGQGHSLRGGHFAQGPGASPYSSMRSVNPGLPEEFTPFRGFRCVKNP